MKKQILLDITYNKKILRTEEPPLLGYESKATPYLWRATISTCILNYKEF